VVLVAFIDGILVANHYHTKTDNVKALEAVELESIFEKYEIELEVEEVILEDRIVPFTSQAPDGIWGAPWDNYAEEAIISMVLHWNKQEAILSREQARVSLLDIDQFTESETLNLIQIKEVLNDILAIRSEIMESPSVESISAALGKGSIIVVPVNGQILDSPYYGDPAPRNHMVLVYGELDGAFIVHDPGTSRGEAVEYEKEKILESIQDLDGEFRVLIIQP